MTSTIKVNTIQNTCGADIIKESSNTITIGASGDTVTLASGASQTGFGRTGTVDWVTDSIKTATFTATSGEGYFTNTTGGVFTVNLPSSPSAGDIVAVSDYAEKWATNNLTLGRNGSNIEGEASDLSLNQKGASITLVYVDGTKGWIVVNAGNSKSGFDENFIVATGGTESESGDCKIHTFTGPGTFTVCQVSDTATDNVVSYTIVAGGGGGGSGGGSGSSGAAAGGGGAGGFREVSSPSAPFTASPLDGYPSAPNRVTITAQAYSIVVGGGGASVVPNNTSNSGNNSSFGGIVSAGGGGGGSRNPSSPSIQSGKSGGSGGGGITPCSSIGSGNTPPTTPSQGNNGGAGNNPSGNNGGGGGGGASAVGADSTNGSNGGIGGNGGAGVASSITGSPVTRAGGGGGAGGGDAPSGHNNAGGTGGSGGGGNGGATGGNGTAGTTNTGGGGGAGGSHPGKDGQQGGSGIVIIRYRFK
jgi:hypothetical protein